MLPQAISKVRWARVPALSWGALEEERWLVQPTDEAEERALPRCPTSSKETKPGWFSPAGGNKASLV